MNKRYVDYSNFNAALDKLMQGSGDDFKQPSVSTINSLDEQTAYPISGSGTLIVQVTTAGGALPIQGAEVTIMENDGAVIDTQLTNNSGKTAAITLDAPSIQYSQTPGNLLPYSTYNVTVKKDGYYTEEFLNIAVFDRIASIQPVALEPLGENALPDDMRITNEQVPQEGGL